MGFRWWKASFLFGLSLLAALAPAYDAWAQPESTYMVQGVEVSFKKGNNPSKARQKAIEDATEIGLAQLLRRLTTQTTWQRHPEILKKVDVTRALQQFNLVSEEISPNYQARFDLRFSRDYIHNLLSRLSIPFSEVGAGPVLLLPVLDLSARQLLWEETNPWREKLSQATKNAGLVRFVLPVGDPQEIMMLTPEMVAFGAGDMIMSVAQNYNAKAAVVARFQMGINKQGQREALLDLTWYGDHDVPPQYLQIPLTDGHGLDAAMSTVAERAILAVEESWRQLYMLEFDQPGQILVHYGAPSLVEMEDLRTRLNQVPIVEDVFLRMASLRQAILQINFFGTPEKLQILAKEKGVTLGQWNQRWVMDLGSEEKNTAAYGMRAQVRTHPLEENKSFGSFFEEGG